jgi:periplasmic divalent cation tolerance protein
MKDVVFIYTTWPDAETADRAARAAVEQRRAACANTLAPIVSIFRWEGGVDSATETPVVFKTTAEAAAGLRELILEMHPYELPCIVALPIAAAQSHPAFLGWIAAETG